ncbi:MAG: tRNA pseudouridine(55) synthase TruB [Spirochaetales bacterium]
MNGILNILKPSGMTSNAVLAKVKKRFNIKRVGHLGTLDPAGVGVLPVTIGKATRLFDYFLGKDKTYLAIFTFGKTTDTLDSEGKVLFENGLVPTKGKIQGVLPKLVGKVEQIPPQFSAKNINGRRAYELARKGEDFELKPKSVQIYSINLLEQTNENSFLFKIECSSGTYIRSICRDMANLFNTYAYMSSIIRTTSGMFKIEDAVTLDELLNGQIEDYLIGFETILKDFKKVNVKDEDYNKLLNGVKIEADKKISNEEFLLYSKNELFGIATVSDGYYKIKVNLKVND